LREKSYICSSYCGGVQKYYKQSSAGFKKISKALPAKKAQADDQSR